MIVNCEIVNSIPRVRDCHLMRVISWLVGRFRLFGFIEIDLGESRLGVIEGRNDFFGEIFDCRG